MEYKQGLTALLARNALLNFVGQIIPLLIAVAALPFIINKLGTELFGILSIVWAVIGYFILFDFGLGQATTKFIAQFQRESKQDEVIDIIWISLFIHLLLGIIGGVLIFLISPILINHLLNIPAALASTVQDVFFILAPTIPFVIVSGVLRASLAAVQRFDLINAVNIPSSSLNYLAPVIVLLLNYGLQEIMLAFLCTRIITTFIYLALCFQQFPSLKKKIHIDSRLLKPLFSFGIWVALSNFLAPLYVYLDRFVIGSVLTLSAVSYYTAPYDTVTRVWIIPVSITATLYPAFSAFGREKDRKQTEKLYSASLKYLLLTMNIITLVLVFFAKDILYLWLGEEFSQKSTLVFQILAIGVFFNSLSRIPFSLLRGFGRPDIPAKFQLLELPIYLTSLHILVTQMGIIGVAIAWTARVLLDTLLLFGAAAKLYKFRIFRSQDRNFPKMLLSLILISTFMGCISYTMSPLLLRTAIIAPILVVYVYFSWRYLLTSLERADISRTLCRLRSQN